MKSKEPRSTFKSSWTTMKDNSSNKGPIASVERNGSDLVTTRVSSHSDLDSLIVRRELCGRGGGLDNGEDGNCEKISSSTSRKYLDNQTGMPKDENDNRKPQRNILPDESNNNCNRSSSVTTDNKTVENSNVGKNVNKLSRPVTNTKVSNKVQPVVKVIDKYT